MPYSKKDLEEMKEIFLDDSMEKISEIDDQLQNLDKNLKDDAALTELYRIIHSFKGAAGTVELTKFEKFFHTFESLLSDIQKNKVPMTSKIVDELFKYLEFIEESLDLIKKSKPIDKLSEKFTKQLEGIRNSSGEVKNDDSDQRRIFDLLSQHGLDDYSSMSIDFEDKKYLFMEIEIVLEDNIKLKLARLLVILKFVKGHGSILKSFPPLEELLQEKFDKSFKFLFHTEKSAAVVKKSILKSGDIESVNIKTIDPEKAKSMITTEEKKVELSAVERSIENSKNVETVKVKLDLIDKQVELFGELLINTKRFENIVDQLNHPDAKELIYQMKHYMVNLQDIILKMQLVPISKLFRLFPRMARSLSQSQGKDVDIRIKHHDIKVDRKILSHIGDIITHLLRNAIDHGIETTKFRYGHNKNKKAIIVVDTNIENNVLKLVIKDDGKGIDPAEIAKLAVTKGLYTQNEIDVMTDEQILNIIFTPNFSSAKNITNTSGRGLGLNIVKNKVEGLNGSITFITKVGKGTAFKVMLPLTRTLVRALLVESGEQIYSIALDDIERLMEIPLDKIVQEGNQHFYKSEEEEAIQIIDLGKIFNVYTKSRLENDVKTIKVVRVRKGNKIMGLIVDEFIKETEIVIKELDDASNSGQGIAGAAILEDGRVSLIVDPFTIEV